MCFGESGMCCDGEELVTEGPWRSQALIICHYWNSLCLVFGFGLSQCICDFFPFLCHYCVTIFKHWANRQFYPVTRNSVITQGTRPREGPGEPLPPLSPTTSAPSTPSPCASRTHKAAAPSSLLSIFPKTSPDPPVTHPGEASLATWTLQPFSGNRHNKWKNKPKVHAFVCVYFNLMKSDQGKKTSWQLSYQILHGCNNGRYHVSKSCLPWWLWCFGALVPRGATAKWRCPGSFSFKVTRFRLGLGCSDGDSVTPIMPCTMRAQIVPVSHKHWILILTLAPGELLQHQKVIRGWSTQTMTPKGLGLNPWSVLASVWPGSDLNSLCAIISHLGNEVTVPCAPFTCKVGLKLVISCCAMLSHSKLCPILCDPQRVNE